MDVKRYFNEKNLNMLKGAGMLLILMYKVPSLPIVLHRVCMAGGLSLMTIGIVIQIRLFGVQSLLLCNKPEKRGILEWLGRYWVVYLSLHIWETRFLNWGDVYAFIPAYWLEEVIFKLLFLLFVGFCIVLCFRRVSELNGLKE